jgi:nucleotide-binding universal stress UspA family protein/quercetin dioxygenase-like cupin family protein
MELRIGTFPRSRGRRMNQIKTILHPTDFSENAACAFGVACSLAATFDARLILLHVTPPSGTAGSQGVPAEQVVSEDELAWPQPSSPKISVEHRVVRGNAADEVLRAAGVANCDFIVMGTHGRSGLKRALMGSVAESVLRKAVCPVLTVKTPDQPSDGKRDAFRVQTILHPTDFSASSDYAFETACWLAEQYAARLILLHVMPPSSIPAPGAHVFDPLQSAESQETVRGQFAWPQPRNKKILPEHRLAEGDATDETLALATAADCGLIVMGTEGRSGLNRVLVGSTAERVLRKAPCPVLTVKPPPGWTSSVEYSSSRKPGEIVDVRTLEKVPASSSQRRRTLLKTTQIELIRIALPANETVPETESDGETLVQCLQGKVAFTNYGKTQVLESGHLLYLPKGETFTVTAIEDASLLVTTLLPKD